MTRSLETSPALERQLARLHPTVAQALEDGAREALRFHAPDLGVEHLLVALLADEHCAATRIVQHAFSDPETIAIETLALAPGVMMVSAERCVPFSPLGKLALEEARAEAVRRKHAAVEEPHLTSAALARLPEEHRSALEEVGLRSAELFAGLPESTDPLEPEGPLLQPFSNGAKRALSSAARTASRLGRGAISPAHLVQACLEGDPELAERSGLTASRARMALDGRDADESPPAGGPLGPNEPLVALLETLPDGADTGGLLGGIVTAGSAELRGLLRRQKVTGALLEHAAGRIYDAPRTGAPAG